MNEFVFLSSGGIHRVQRVPITEKAGRPHTSTAVVVVLPKPSNITIDIQQKDLKVILSLHRCIF